MAAWQFVDAVPLTNCVEQARNRISCYFTDYLIRLVIRAAETSDNGQIQRAMSSCRFSASLDARLGGLPLVVITPSHRPADPSFASVVAQSPTASVVLCGNLPGNCGRAAPAALPCICQTLNKLWLLIAAATDGNAAAIVVSAVAGGFPLELKNAGIRRN